MQPSDFLRPLRKHAGAVIIIAPVLLMVIGLMSSSSAPKSAVSRPPLTITSAPTQMLTPTTIASPEATLDLTGPAVCKLKTPDKAVTVFIKTRNIYAEVASSQSASFVLVKSDCAYLWEKNSKTGDRICGINEYLPLLEKSTPSQLFANGAKQQSTDMCVKQPVADYKFSLPLGVVFKDKPLSEFKF